MHVDPIRRTLLATAMATFVAAPVAAQTGQIAGSVIEGRTGKKRQIVAFLEALPEGPSDR